MSSAGYHAAEEGTLARSTGGAAARGAILIALALGIGLLLVVFALDDPQTEIVASEASADEVDSEGTGDAAGDGVGDADGGAAPEVGTPDGNDDESATATIPTIPEEGDVDAAPAPTEGEILPPNEVNVLVANGTGGAGVAGGVADVLNADGYITQVSNAPATVSGVIFYQPGFSANAIAVGQALGAAPDVVLPAPADIAVDPGAISDGRLAAAQIVVIVGAEGVVPVS